MTLKTRIMTREIEKLADNTQDQFESLSKISFLNSIEKECVSITTGTPITINHGLGKEVNWITTSKSANSVVWDSQSTNNQSKSTLILNSSANVIIDLLIY